MMMSVVRPVGTGLPVSGQLMRMSLMTNLPTLKKKIIPLALTRTCANFFGDWNRDARPPLREKSRHPARVMVTETVHATCDAVMDGETLSRFLS
jgi:hypothetical protein